MASKGTEPMALSLAAPDRVRSEVPRFPFDLPGAGPGQGLIAPRKKCRPVAVRWNTGIMASATLLVSLAVQIFSGPAAAWARTFAVTVERKPVPIGAGMTYNAWTYNGAVPGPVLRLAQGEDVEVSLTNSTSDAHGLAIDAAQISPGHFSGDPRQPVHYRFRPQFPGVFLYHCNAIPVLDHVAGGMYGAVIVEPKGGWPHGHDAQEITIVQSEFYGLPDSTGFIKGDHAKMVEATPDFVVFNGQLNKYDVDHPIPIKARKLVRIFFVNAGPNLTSGFHISGVVFSTVYRAGNPVNALRGLDALDVGPGEGALFEFTVNEPGDYLFADVQRAHQYKGAMGILRAGW